MQQTQENAERQEKIRLEISDICMRLQKAIYLVKSTSFKIHKLDQKIRKEEEAEEIRRLNIELKEHERNVKRLEKLKENLEKEFFPCSVEGCHRHHHDERYCDDRHGK